MKFKHIKTQIEENHKILIIMLTFFGLSYQVLNLIILSSDAIKFFSITTAISDSIIISINALIFFVFISLYRALLGLCFLDLSLIVENTSKDKISFYRKFEIIIHIFIFSILFFIKTKLHFYNIPIKIIYLTVFLL